MTQHNVIKQLYHHIYVNNRQWPRRYRQPHVHTQHKLNRFLSISLLNRQAQDQCTWSVYLKNNYRFISATWN